MVTPAYCRRCGSRLKDGTHFCADCGVAVADTEDASASGTGAADNALVWQVEIPLLSNRFVLRDLAFGVIGTFVVAGPLLGALFTWGGGDGGWRAGFIFAASFSAVYLVAAVLTFAVLFGNRWPFEFVLNEHGVVQNNVSQKARAIHRFAWILALLTGRPLMAGPGLIAQSREVVGVPWRDVRVVKTYAALGVIYIKGGLLETVRLYCTPSNFADVAARVQREVKEHAPTATLS